MIRRIKVTTPPTALIFVGGERAFDQMGNPLLLHLLECRPPSEAPLFMFGDIRPIARRAYGTREPLRVVNEKSRSPSHSVLRFIKPNQIRNLPNVRGFLTRPIA